MEDRFKVLKDSKEVSELNGLAFEEYLSQLFSDLGYDVTKTSASGDYGVDLLIRKDGKLIAVQAKQYVSSVGFDAVKEVYFAKAKYMADEAWVVCTADFTKQAREAASSVEVRLLDGKELDKLIALAHEGAAQISVGLPSVSGARAKKRSAINVLSANGEVLKQYRGADSEIVVPEGVVEIGVSAFSAPKKELEKFYESNNRTWYGLTKPYCDSKNIQSVVLPNGLKKIGAHAFHGCSSLNNVCLPDSLEEIDDYAFCYCKSLRNVELPEGVRIIGESAFAICAFTSVVIKRGVKYGKGCFHQNEYLVKVEIQNGVSEIPEDCFGFCTSLEEIDIPEGVESIGSGAFSFCSSLNSVSLPSSLKSLAINAFEDTKLAEGGLIPDLFDLSGVEIVDWKGQPIRRGLEREAYERAEQKRKWRKAPKVQLPATFDPVSIPRVLEKCAEQDSRLVLDVEKAQAVGLKLSALEEQQHTEVSRLSDSEQALVEEHECRIADLRAEWDSTPLFRVGMRRRLEQELLKTQHEYEAAQEDLSAKKFAMAKRHEAEYAACNREWLESLQRACNLRGQIRANMSCAKIPGSWFDEGVLTQDEETANHRKALLSWLDLKRKELGIRDVW